MSRLPIAERRQIFLARERARQAMRVQTAGYAPAPVLDDSERSRRRRKLVLEALTIALLAAATYLAAQVVAFRLPTSFLDALLPRL